MTLTDNKDGTATIKVAATVKAGTISFLIDAGNKLAPDALQLFTVTVN